MQGPESHSYFSQRLRLHYVDWGNPDAPPLLLIHGGRDHCRNWDWVAEALRDDYRILAPDLRGHGDSSWFVGGAYAMADYVYDIAQLVHRKSLAPVTVIGHSLGGSIALHYAGVYPETVKALVAIEGLGPSPAQIGARKARPIDDRLREWIETQRGLSGRLPRRYDSLEDAYKRMQEANPRLSEAQAHHLTVHGANQNEDGTYSWKFDNYSRADRPVGIDPEESFRLWAAISCPTLLVRGLESWVGDPDRGRARRPFPQCALRRCRRRRPLGASRPAGRIPGLGARLPRGGGLTNRDSLGLWMTPCPLRPLPKHPGSPG